MTNTEKMELGLIPIIGGMVWLAAPMLPGQITLGTALLWTAALVLLQGLIRDLLLLASRRHAVQVGLPRKLRCMCVESTVGATGIIAGLVLLGATSDRALGISHWGWTLAVVTALSVGFAMKDYVFEWSPFRLRRDKDHLNIVFAWKE